VDPRLILDDALAIAREIAVAAERDRAAVDLDRGDRVVGVEQQQVADFGPGLGTDAVAGEIPAFVEADNGTPSVAEPGDFEG
jgi:hypothetical protein